MNKYITKNHISINEGMEYKLINASFIWKKNSYIDIAICLFWSVLWFNYQFEYRGFYNPALDRITVGFHTKFKPTIHGDGQFLQYTLSR